MKKLLLGFIFVILTTFLSSLAWAGTVTLEWDGNLEADLAGYHLYRAERIGDKTTAWEKVTTIAKDATTYEDTVEDGKNYAWLLTAFDTFDNESFVSNMVELYNRTPPRIVQNLRKE